MTTATHPEAHRLLLEARVRLVERLTQLGAEETGELRADVEFGDGFADAAAATAERTEVLGLVDSLKKNLDDVDSALRRLEEGRYGDLHQVRAGDRRRPPGQPARVGALRGVQGQSRVVRP